MKYLLSILLLGCVVLGGCGVQKKVISEQKIITGFTSEIIPEYELSMLEREKKAEKEVVEQFYGYGAVKKKTQVKEYQFEINGKMRIIHISGYEENIDFFEFVKESSSYAFSENYVYRDVTIPGNVWELEQLLTSNIESFRVINDVYAEDKNNFYTRISYPDYIETWILDKRDIDGEFQIISGAYAKDDNNMYYGGLLLSGADIETFETLSYGHSLSKDKNHVYKREGIVKGADTKSFEMLSREYARDFENLYCLVFESGFGGIIVIKDIDFDTFELTPEMAPEYIAKDKNHKYFLDEVR